jgi:transcription-repair coupling factor (superfamily II helicase)
LNIKDKNIDTFGKTLIGAAPGPIASFWLAERFRTGACPAILHVAVDDRALDRMAAAFGVLAPDVDTLLFPAWDCLPYDRVGPNGAIAARRIGTLWALAQRLKDGDRADGPPLAVLTTFNALLQKVPPPASFQGESFAVEKGSQFDLDAFLSFAAANGYGRTETVMEPGEFAIRGGIIDIFPAGLAEPLRVDLFGDTVDEIRSFDPLTQITDKQRAGVVLKPVSELVLTEDSIARFRSGYRGLFGAVQEGDTLYESISDGRRVAGMEHWLPLFHDSLGTIFDYLPDVAVSLGVGTLEARDMRFEQIEDYYRARNDLGSHGSGNIGEIYNPLPPDKLYLDEDAWGALLSARPVVQFDSFARPDSEKNSVDAGGRLMRNFAADARTAEGNPFDLAVTYMRNQLSQGNRLVVACASDGSLNRVQRLIVEHGFRDITLCSDWPEVEALPSESAATIKLDIEQGFTAPGIAVIAETDILGQRLARSRRRERAADVLAAELSAIDEDDLVVHIDHGIGRYDGLETLQVPGSNGLGTVSHDCLRLMYGGGDKLYVPVENIDVLTRYGEDQGTVSLDRLGGAAWQAKKSRMRNRIREMAEELLKVAAARTLAHAQPMKASSSDYEEFCARFPYSESDDQQTTITETLEDLAGERPMDRLVCGDVGFGKTEIALRAAMTAVMSGTQVAVVVPTTLLARQHSEVFETRFQGFPVEIAQLSRLVPPAETEKTKKRLAEGTIDIVIGTHALLSESIEFANLGLLIVDEEQHFGVAHKERLKRFRSNVHVLTLTATPIPRTLQLALTGVKDLSIIATPPVDRLAVRTFVLPFDPLVIREAIRREMHRGGQCFYVCPRISDIPGVMKQITEIVPDARIQSVHGRMGAADLERTMASFIDGAFDILVSTNIIESGLDMPNVNTIIIHRAEMFGLGQLYQLRGRVGRSRVRAYAYLTLPPRRVLTPAAAKRLEVMQTLDNLGAGFTLASHDLDIRGAGNLLGEEQSGHIREVGVELYQHMLEETVAELKGAAPAEDEWSPQVNVDIPVLIPDSYVADLGLRLGLYRRIAGLLSRDEVEAFAAELIDRFGPLPKEVENLLSVVTLKQGCKLAGIEKVEAGKRGCLVSFRHAHFANPEGLIAVIASSPDSMKLRPDHTLVIRADWPKPEDQVKGLHLQLDTLVQIALAKTEAAAD